MHYASHGTPVRSDDTQAHPSACRAAIVTEADEADGEPFLGLAVLNPTGLAFVQDVLPGHPTRGGTWHWPERTPDA